eukprot:2232155-Amphidinium_carterae.1
MDPTEKSRLIENNNAQARVGLVVHSPACQTTKDLITAEDLVNSSEEQVAIVQKRNKRCKNVVRMIAGEEVEKEESKQA